MNLPMMTQPYRLILMMILTLALSFGYSVASATVDFTKAVENSQKAIVHITVQRSSPDSVGTTPGIGAGSIIRSDGLIVTSYHVVANANSIWVKLRDHSIHQAKLIGYDQGTDLAVVKIAQKNLPTLPMSKTAPKVGEWVIAAGTPYGFEFSYSQGIVSGLGRTFKTERYVPFIQTDAAINPGNSGGPLMNLNGELIGVNAQIISESGSYAGLSFSVPANVVAHVTNDIIKHGTVHRPWLGLGFKDMTHQLANTLGLKQVKGAIVAHVLPRSPAAKAGIQVGDIIVGVGQGKIIKASDIPPIFGQLGTNGYTNLHIIRGDEKKSLKLMLQKAPNRSEFIRAIKTGEPLPK